MLVNILLAYGIVVGNPVGTLGPDAAKAEPQPYFRAGETEPVQYATFDECSADLASIVKRAKAAAQELNSLSNDPLSVAIYKKQMARIESFSCQKLPGSKDEEAPDEVYVVPATQQAPVPQVQEGLLEIWRIGRQSPEGFRGTLYDVTSYKDERECYEAFGRAQGAVYQKAVQEGGTTSVANEFVGRFRSTYSCLQLRVTQAELDKERVMIAQARQAEAVKPSVPVKAPESAYSAPAQAAQAQTYVAPVNASAGVSAVAPQVESYAPVAQVPAAAYQSRVSNGIAQAMPTRPYFVAEHVRAADGTAQWMKFQGVFQSPAACWEGLGKYIKAQEKFVYGQYQVMGDSVQARQWYWDRMAELNARKSRITCVTE